MPRTVADEFAETLAAAGVKRIYGIVGDGLNGLGDLMAPLILNWKTTLDWFATIYPQGTCAS